MNELEQWAEKAASYLQMDAPGRQARFGDFLSVLRESAALTNGSKAEGVENARRWACRAVSPLLDYSSLMQLRRHLPPLGTLSGSAAPLRLAILGGPTTIQLRQLIEVFLAGEGIAAEIFEGEYGLFRHEILTPGSSLDAFGPQVIFIATGARDVMRFPAVDADTPSAESLAETEITDWEHLWHCADARWNATIIQNNFEIVPDGVLGHHALRHRAARSNYLGLLNRLTAERAPGHVILHDLNGLTAEFGTTAWFDPRLYHEFKMPCGADCLPTYAYSVVSLLRALRGKSKKVVALDLDNTLWGGVVGDLGPGGIKLGQGSGEGEAFLAFQYFLKDLSNRGIVLAVCSKNDPQKAREPFEKRDDMVLKMSDIACFVANWDNKADNLRSIAERLELKLDSFVFVDDNPAERAIVRRFVPEVAVPDLPEDPSGYIQAVVRHRYFETTSFTREDAARSRYYAENARRQELAAGAADLTVFLKSLAMRMTVEPVHDLNIERVTQLVNKSNQFNLTTRRYTLAEIRAVAESPDWRTLTFSLRDSLGDNGLISVILLRKDGETMVVDTWVMSCRVLQRGVEQFARNELVTIAQKDRCAGIRGIYIPTAKNGLVVDHYKGLGFQSEGTDNGQTFWHLPVGGDVAPLPHFIEREPNHE